MINEAFVHFDVLQNAVTKLKSNYEVRIICEKLEVSNKVAEHSSLQYLQNLVSFFFIMQGFYLHFMHSTEPL